jgi:hypothetical protein
VYPRILNRIREKTRSGDYVMTLHAEEEMNFDDFTIFDVENAILTGSIIERQSDSSTREFKYVIEGSSLTGRPVGIVVKLSPTSKLVMITVYEA